MPPVKRKRSRNFAARRVLIAVASVAALGLIGFAAWYFGRGLIPQKTPAGSSQTESLSSSASEISSAPVQSSEPEASSGPETQPEPETGPKASPDDWELLLVNPYNLLPEGYSPELVAITDNYRVDARIADSVKQMFAKAKGDGINLIICSAYRSVEYQQKLFDDKTKEIESLGRTEDEAAAVAATIIAVPGTSEHHTGLAMDIVTPLYTELDDGFAETPAFQWLNAHAADYGFIMRYPKDKQDITKIIYEPWHYRYVGVENAKLIKAGGLCLEEYLASLSGEAAFAEPPESTDEPSEEPADKSGGGAEDGGEA